MYLVKWVYFKSESGNYTFQVLEAKFDFIEELNFAILTLSLILLAGAGYIINDVFDITEDSVNKPDKQIINVHISPESANKVYWILNIISFIGALYLSIYYQSSVLVIFITTLISLLWLYSYKLKRKYLIGNVLVGLVTASTALIAASFLQGFINLAIESHKDPTIYVYTNDDFLWGIASFIFILITLLSIPREIIKDIQDIEGDKIANANTIPIASGVFPAKIIASAVLFAYLTPFFYMADYPLNLMVIIPILLTIILILSSNTKKMFAISSLAIKLNMLVGMLFIIYVSIAYN